MKVAKITFDNGTTMNIDITGVKAIDVEDVADVKVEYNEEQDVSVMIGPTGDTFTVPGNVDCITIDAKDMEQTPTITVATDAPVVADTVIIEEEPTVDAPTEEIPATPEVAVADAPTVEQVEQTPASAEEPIVSSIDEVVDMITEVAPAEPVADAPKEEPKKVEPVTDFVGA